MLLNEEPGRLLIDAGRDGMGPPVPNQVMTNAPWQDRQALSRAAFQSPRDSFLPSCFDLRLRLSLEERRKNV